VPGRGLPGDRYFSGTGTFSRPGKSGQDLTLIEAEALEALAAEHGIELDAAEARRNLLTRGIDLNALVGERFFVGEVECRGRRLCDPCSHLERLTKPGVLRGLAARGGLRADVIGAGAVRVGDEVTREAPPAPPATTITPYRNGPYLVRGPFTLLDQDGTEIETGRRVVALCRCGRSRTRPFCDGTHKTIGFRSAGGREDDRPSPASAE
jgi:CDGSH-type Zn-finger protein